MSDNVLKPIRDALKWHREVTWQNFKKSVEENDHDQTKAALSHYRMLGHAEGEFDYMAHCLDELCAMFERKPSDPHWLSMVTEYVESMKYVISVIELARDAGAPSRSKFVAEDGDVLFLDNTDKVA